jgi:hypothetical protein
MPKVINVLNVEVNCVRMIRIYKGHMDAAKTTFAQLTTYVRENGVTREELKGYFKQVYSNETTAYQYACSIVRTARRATPHMSAMLATGEATFAEAKASVTEPRKTPEEKLDTLWKRNLWNAAIQAVENNVSDVEFINVAENYYAQANG